MNSCLPSGFCEAHSGSCGGSRKMLSCRFEAQRMDITSLKSHIDKSQWHYWPQLTEWPCSPLTTVRGGFLWLNCIHALGLGSEDFKALTCSSQGQQCPSPKSLRGTGPCAGSQRSGPSPSSAKVWLHYLSQAVSLFWVLLFLSTKWEASMIGLWALRVLAMMTFSSSKRKQREEIDLPREVSDRVGQKL